MKIKREVTSLPWSPPHAPYTESEPEKRSDGWGEYFGGYSDEGEVEERDLNLESRNPKKNPGFGIPLYGYSDKEGEVEKKDLSLESRESKKDPVLGNPLYGYSDKEGEVERRDPIKDIEG